MALACTSRASSVWPMAVDQRPGLAGVVRLDAEQAGRRRHVRRVGQVRRGPDVSRGADVVDEVSRQQEVPLAGERVEDVGLARSRPPPAWPAVNASGVVGRGPGRRLLAQGRPQERHVVGLVLGHLLGELLDDRVGERDRRVRRVVTAVTCRWRTWTGPGATALYGPVPYPRPPVVSESGRPDPFTARRKNSASKYSVFRAKVRMSVSSTTNRFSPVVGPNVVRRFCDAPAELPRRSRPGRATPTPGRRRPRPARPGP